MEKLKQWLDRMPKLAALSTYIDLIESPPADNPGAALDAAKCLLESLAKTILRDRGVTFSNHSNISFLVKEAIRTAEALDRVSDAENLEKIVQGFGTIANAIGSLRNKFGPISHGQDIYANTIDAMSVDLVIESTLTVVHFLLALHSKEICTSSRISYEDNPDFNRYIDLQSEQSGDDIFILEVAITPSKALFYEDVEAYRERLILFRDEKMKALHDIQQGFSEMRFEAVMQFQGCFTDSEFGMIKEIFNRNKTRFSQLPIDEFEEYFTKQAVVREAN